MKKFCRITKEECIALENLVEKVAHLLPAQAPLQFFVHHNTLHNYECLPFKEALHKASQRFGAEPFMDEAFFQNALDEKRIVADDVEKIILQECDIAAQPVFAGGPTHFDFRKWRVMNLFTVPNAQSLNWWIYENHALEKVHYLSGSALQEKASRGAENFTAQELSDLWNVFEIREYVAEPQPECLRIRDKIHSQLHVDIDELTKPLLIKLAAAYLDQGVAFDVMPQRHSGFLTSFQKIYNSKILDAAWMAGLTDECSAQQNLNLDAAQIIIDILNIFEVEQEDHEEFIAQTLLSLRGWAGMFYQYECFPERVPVHYLPAKIIDFLAVQLTIELVAARFVLAKNNLAFAELNQKTAREHFALYHNSVGQKILQYEAFVAAQAFGLKAIDFAQADVGAKAGAGNNAAKKWCNEIKNFNNFERRYYLYLAYENHHRQMVLDSLINHQKLLAQQQKKLYKFQVIACFDEREESFRRHLEETCADVETFGAAGFFAVAMQYIGLEDIKPRALCPVVITPNILVEEVALDDEDSRQYFKRRKILGKILNFKRKIRKSLILGALWSCTIGMFKLIPLIGRSLFPLQAAKLSHHFHRRVTADRPHTRLRIERLNDDERKFGFKVGFSLDEMTNSVFTILNFINLKQFAPLVVIVGHGSSSLNNPHEAAYNCGATGGGRGFANSRAFAMMANDERVRRKLAARGLAIPVSTRFVGAYHDTCDDSMSYYDEDLLAPEFSEKLLYAKNMFAKACESNAQERCRRFDSVPKNVSATEAKEYVEQRAIDLAQPRPEYGHGTNAICIIGRREKTLGLFLDRRAFLISYDPQNDPSGNVLGNILQAAVPVGSGISLEYYFSRIDQANYGCGTKLPHNVTGLIGVMEGSSSDLRTGLPWQTVELHEPMRLLTIIEASAATLSKIAQEKPQEVGALVHNGWIQLVAWDPSNDSFSFYRDGKFVPHEVTRDNFVSVSSSKDYYGNCMAHLDCAHVTKSRVFGTK